MDSPIIKVGVVGISGYSGCALLELLLKHPHVRVTYVCANQTRGYISDIWPKLAGTQKLYCEPFDHKKAIKSCDVVFLAVPHTTSMLITPKLLGKVKVIDLSGDYRLKSSVSYEKWYGKKHRDLKNLSKSVYGLPELYREKIKKAKLIANPGCYPTAALLGLIPLMSILTKGVNSLVIDAKSGTTGAGKKTISSLMFSEVNENFKAYKVCQHQHSPEIEQVLNRISSKRVGITFVPHLLPVNRGILETMYIHTNEKCTLEKLHKIYLKFYKIEPFVRILALGNQPELKNVTHTNYCDIGLACDKSKNMIVITTAIDNLTKGAAGQAVQNLNIMCGFPEATGLI